MAGPRFNANSKEFDLLKKELRSIALSVGPLVFVSVEQLDRDYADLNGHPIRYYEYGFHDLYELLAAMADSIMLIDYGADGVAVVPISGDKTRHMENLIAEQRPNEPTRFGGVVPGLDNKEQNRKQYASQRNARGRGRSVEPRRVADDPQANRKRTISTFSTTAVFEENVGERRIEPKQTVAASLKVRISPRTSVEKQSIPISDASVVRVTSPTTSAPDKVVYTREELIEIQKITSTKPDAKYLYHNDGEDYPDMDLIQFVVRNVLEIVKSLPDGVDLSTLTFLYKEKFPSDPPLELVESLGYSMEDFFAGNFNGELNVAKSLDGVVTLNYRSSPTLMVNETHSPTNNVVGQSNVAQKTSLEEAILINLDDKTHQTGVGTMLDSPVHSNVLHNFVSTSKVVPMADLILLDDDPHNDDPAVVAFERRASPLSPRPVTTNESILHQSSPLVSRKSPSAINVITSEEPSEFIASTSKKLNFMKSDCASSIITSVTDADRRSTYGTSSNSLFEWPEKAPLLDPTKFSENVKISQKLWQEIYEILRDSNSGVEHRRFTIEYARRFQKTLGGKDFYDKCGVKNLQELLFEIQFIEVFENYSGNLAYRLRRSRGQGLNLREKEEKAKKISKSTIGGGDGSVRRLSSIEDDDDDEEELDPDTIIDGSVKLPQQPPELLPPGGRVSDIIRGTIYHLLRRKFKHGIDITSFTMAYSKFYKRSINAQTECKMSYSEIYRCMRDIIDIGEDDDGLIWLKAKPISKVCSSKGEEEILANILDLNSVPIEPPKTMPVDVCDRLEILLEPCGSNGVPYCNFKTLYTQKSLLAWFSLYGYHNFDQLVDRAVSENKIDIFTTNFGEKRVRLKKFKPIETQPTPVESVDVPFQRQPRTESYSIFDPNQYYQATVPQLQPPKIRSMINTAAIRRQVESNVRMNTVRSSIVPQTAHEQRMPPPIANIPVVKTRADIDDAVYEGSFEYMKLSQDQEYNVVLSSIQNPGHFHCQLSSMDDRFEKMMDEMKTFYSDSSISNFYRVPKNLLNRGFICVAYAAQVWCRVQIVDTTLKDGKMMVLFVDFGASRLTPVNDLRLLKRDFFVNSLPAIAIRCCLAQIDPIDNNVNSWSPQAKKFFSKLFDNASSTSLRVVDFKSDDNTPLVKLKTKSKNYSNYFDVAERMVRENYATYRTTSFHQRRPNDNNLGLDENNELALYRRNVDASTQEIFDDFIDTATAKRVPFEQNYFGIEDYNLYATPTGQTPSNNGPRIIFQPIFVPYLQHQTPAPMNVRPPPPLGGYRYESNQFTDYHQPPPPQSQPSTDVFNPYNNF